MSCVNQPINQSVNQWFIAALDAGLHKYSEVIKDKTRWHKTHIKYIYLTLQLSKCSASRLRSICEHNFCKKALSYFDETLGVVLCFITLLCLVVRKVAYNFLQSPGSYKIQQKPTFRAYLLTDLGVARSCKWKRKWKILEYRTGMARKTLSVSVVKEDISSTACELTMLILSVTS